MSQTAATAKIPTRNGRNQTMECCKLIASFFVVFIHVLFPGKLGRLIDCLGRFAVPMFFMISGYFNYQASSATVLRRAKHIFKLIIGGTVLYLLWGCIETELGGGSTVAYLRAAIPDPIEVVQIILLHIHPYAGHLWYLNAILTCYLCFWAYTAFQEEKPVNYRGFYTVCACLFTINFIFDIVASGNESADFYASSRNGWLMGLPMFSLGLFIREYQERIFRCFHLTTKKLVLLVIGGMLFSVLQWDTTGIGIMPLGTLIEVLALMLLMVSHPTIVPRSSKAESIILSFGPISTWIYISHLMFGMAYGLLLQPTVAAAFPDTEGYLQPLIVLGMSVIAAIVWEIAMGLLKKLRKTK